MADPYVGQIIIFAGDYAPEGWAFCNGQTLPIMQNQALYAVIGNRYGGDGRTNFNLPDLRSRVPVHFGQGTGLSPYTVGEQTGAEAAALTLGNMPTHTHTFNPAGATVSVQAGDAGGTTNTPAGNYLCNAGDPLTPGTVVGNTFAPSGSTGTLGTLAGTSVNFGPNSIGNAGGNLPFSTLPPLLALNFIIALVGIYPSRG